jgi:hypothetical protein
MHKRGLIFLLIGVNVMLAAAIMFTLHTPPSALAQAVGARRGEYLLFSARADVTNDAIYLLDAGNKKIYVFRSAFPRNPVTGATAVAHVSTRDISRDFVGQPPAGGQGQPGQPPLVPNPQNPGGARP